MLLLLKNLRDFFSSFSSQSIILFLGKNVRYIFDFLGKVLIVLLVFWGARFLTKFVRKLLYNQRKYPISFPINRALIPTISALVSVIIYILAGSIVLDTLGIISKTAIITLLGSLGLGAGFAMKDLVSNCIAGVVLLIERPFRIGDCIACNETLGTVCEISLLTTKLEDFNGIFIIVPNSNLWGQAITNYTRNPLRRVVIPLFISYKDSFELGIRVLEEVIHLESRFLKNPKPVVVVEALKNNYVEIHLRAWTPNEIYWDVYYDTLFTLKNHVLLKGIALPVAQSDLHVTIKSPNQSTSI